jgi:hypothetical protein
MVPSRGRASMRRMSFGIVPLAFLALALVACGSETPV